MYVQTSKIAYKRHEYSGQRKSLKRVRGGLRQYHDKESRLKVWRCEDTKKKSVKREIVDKSIATQNTQLRTYACVKPKICFEAIYSAPSSSTVKDEPGVIQEDETKILIAKVYHYLEQEYEELKTIYGDLDLTPLSKFGQRTALATGVSERTVLQILKEEVEQTDRSSPFGDTEIN